MARHTLVKSNPDNTLSSTPTSAIGGAPPSRAAGVHRRLTSLESLNTSIRRKNCDAKFRQKSGKNGDRVPWSKVQKRVYRKIMDRMSIWAADGWQVRKIELTTAEGGLAARMPANFNRLIRRMEGHPKGPYSGIDHIKVQTEEGNGVIHAFIAWRGGKTFWIPQKWLCEEWEKIHGASITWIKSIRGDAQAKSSAVYVAAQYVAGQKGNVKLSYSRGYHLFARESVWMDFKAAVGPTHTKTLIAMWKAFLCGQTLLLADGYYWQRDIVGDEGTPYRRAYWLKPWITGNSG